MGGCTELAGEGEGEGEGATGEATHSADQDQNGVITLSELLRVNQFYNSLSLHCQAGTEDGFAPGPGGDEDLHATRQRLQPAGLGDHAVSIAAPGAVLQLGGCHDCSGTEDGYCPGLV